MGFLLLFLIAGVANATNPAHSFRLLHAANSEIQLNENDRSLSNDLIKIRELQTSRIMVHRNFDLKQSAGILRDITSQERDIIIQRNQSTQQVQRSNSNTISRSLELESKKGTFKPKAIPSAKIILDAVTKHQLDSIVEEKYYDGVWHKDEMSTFKYNYNGQVTESKEFEVDDNNLQQISGSYINYHDNGLPLSMEYHSWDEINQVMVMEYKQIVTYNQFNDLSSYEVYGEFYNDETGEFQLIGLEKVIADFDNKGNLIKITYYMWDYDANSWAPHMINEMKIENGIELMFASYVWNIEEGKWYGEWKFEYEPIQEYEYLMNSRYYGWDYEKDEWFIYSQEEFIISEDSHGLVITRTSYEADYDTQILYPIERSIYSKPFSNKFFDQDNYGLIEHQDWNRGTGQWQNRNKTENTFDAFGNITRGSTHGWQDDSQSGTPIWIEIRRFESEVYSDINMISNTIESRWGRNPSTGAFEIVSKKRMHFTYEFIAGRYLSVSRVYEYLDLWGSNNWIKSNKYDTEYNEDGRTTAEKNYLWDNESGDWIYENIREFTYNTAGEYTSSHFQIWVTDNGGEWRTINYAGIITDDWGRLLSFKYAYWSDHLDILIVSTNQEYEYLVESASDYRKTKSIETNSEILYYDGWDGWELHVVTYGSKTYWTYEFVDGIYRVIKTEYYNYEVDDFVPYEAIEYNYHETHPQAIKSETQKEYDSGSGTWYNVRMMEIEYDFSVTMREMVLPFGDEDFEAEIYFVYKPVLAYEYGWDSVESDFSLRHRSLLYFSQAEFSLVPETKDQIVTIYPNPVSDYLFIKLDDNSKSSVLKLYDINGKTMIERSVEGSSQIDVRNFAPGIYFYQIITGDSTLKGKIICK